MTMKKSKTLQHIAAVAVVLLALCLVFIMPVSAEETNAATVDNFAELQAALVAQNTTINIAAPITVEGQLNINYSVTINGNNYLLTADNSVRKLFTINDDKNGNVPADSKITVVFNQVNLTSDYLSNPSSGGRLIDTRGGNFDLTVTGSKLDVYDKSNTYSWEPINIGGYEATKVTVTIQNTEIRTYHGYGIMIWNPVNLQITDSTAVSGYGALYFKNNTDNKGTYGAKGSTVSIVNSKLSSYANWPDNLFGTVIFEDDDITVTVDKDSEIEAYAVGHESKPASQFAFLFSSNTNTKGAICNNDVTVAGKVTLSGDGETGISYNSNVGNTENTVTFENGARANINSVSDYINTDKQFVADAPDEDGYYEVIGKTWEITINPTTWDFETLEEGYETQPTDVQVTIQNTGNQDLQITSVTNTTTAFGYADLVGTVIPASSYSVCQFNIVPELGLKAGTYEDTVTIVTNSTATGTINLKFVVTEKQGDEPGDEVEDLITVTPTSINLGEVVIGSFTYQEVTITNNGESTIDLTIWEDTTLSKYGVGGSDSWKSIEAGKTITLKIYANESLPVGEYSTEMKISNSASNELLISVPITYNLVEGTSPSPDVPVGTTPEFDEVINAEDKEVIITVNEETTKIEGNVVTVKDETNGVTMTMTFTSAPTEGDEEGTITGTVAKVKVTYEEKEAEVNTPAGSTGTVEYTMNLDLTKAGITLPTLNPAFNTDKANIIKETSGLSGHTPLAMITATETAAVNADMRATSGKQVAFTFKISKSLLNGKSMNHLVGYHIADDGKVTKIIPNSGDRKEENNYIYVTIYGDKFSTYAVGISDKAEVVSSNSGSGSGSSGSSSSGSSSSGSSTVTPTVPPTEEPTDDPTDVPDEPEIPETPVTPETPEEPSTPAPLFAVLAGLGAAVVLRRK